MECTCYTDQRRIIPAVFNLKQYLNGAETMKWRLTSHYTDAGQCDLCDYEAFLVICVNGRIDEIMLAKSMIEPTDPDGEAIMELAWNVGQYATELTGYTKYQIIFRSNKLNTLGVIGAGDAAANGVYEIDNAIAEGYLRTWTNKAAGSGYKIKWDSTNARWTIYKANGTTVVDYQTFANPEPCCGTWSTVAVGNNTAAVWTSDEAIMFISETIAADQCITANFPTILRQVWQSVHDLIIRSGVTTTEVTISSANWTGTAAPYELNAQALLPSNLTGCTVQAVRVLRSETGGSYTGIDNVKVYKQNDGSVRVKCLEKIAGKLILTVKGGDGYFMVGAGDKQAIFDALGDIENTLDGITGEP